MYQPDVFPEADPSRHDHSLGEAVVAAALTIEALLVGTYVAATLVAVPSTAPFVALAVGIVAAALAVAATVAAGRRTDAALARAVGAASVVRSRGSRDDSDRLDDGVESSVRGSTDPNRR